MALVDAAVFFFGHSSLVDGWSGGVVEWWSGGVVEWRV